MGSPCNSFYFSENLELFIIKCWGKGLLCYFLRTHLLVKLICYKTWNHQWDLPEPHCRVFFVVFLLLCSHFLQGSVLLQDWGDVPWPSALVWKSLLYTSVASVATSFRAQFSCRTEETSPDLLLWFGSPCSILLKPLWPLPSGLSSPAGLRVMSPDLLLWFGSPSSVLLP